MSDYLLSILAAYGIPVLFGALLIGAVGIPMPATLLLLVAGSFVAEGELQMWPTLAFASVAAIIGDNIGYALGRWGSRHAAQRVAQKFGASEHLRRAEEWTRRWGGIGVFLSRWLITPLGPWLNLTSGLAGYPWPRFLAFDIAGEVLWVALYVMLGKLFDSQVQTVNDTLGNLTWALAGLVVSIFLARKLIHYLRAPDEAPARQKEDVAAEPQIE